jgi:hypothetical protein
MVSDRDAETGRRLLTSYLEDDGIITHAQAAEVKTYCEKTGLSLRDAVVQMKLATQEQATKALAAEHGLPYLDLNETLPDDSVLDQMPRSVVRRHTCLPLFVDDGAVLVACTDVPSHELEDEIRLRFGLPIRPVFASPLSINQCIAKYYAAGLRKEASESTAAAGLKGSSKSGSGKVTRTLSDEEKQERKNLGWILICWTMIILMNLDTFVLWNRVWKFFLPAVFAWFPLVATILIGLPICFLIYSLMIQPNQR